MSSQAYVYIWTHIPTMRWYVGSRTCKGAHLNDGYICSSKIIKPMILENPQEWVKQIIAVGDSVKMLKLETKLLQLTNAACDSMSFNCHNNDGNIKNRLGFKQNKKSCLKISKSLTGKKQSEETRNKKSLKFKGENNPFWNKHHSQKTKDYFSNLYTGVKLSEERCKKISVGQIGKPRTQIAKDAISYGVKNLPKIECKYCANLFSPATYGRWHGDKCKGAVNV